MAIDDRVVETTYGPVLGIDADPAGAASGCGRASYAAPPVGDLRFRAPEPPERWTEVADATGFGPACPQPVFANIPLDLGAAGRRLPEAERLGTRPTPRPATETGDGVATRRRLHPGIQQPSLYDGRRLAARGDVVVVTVNYRLGALGFLDLSSFPPRHGAFDSNLGLRDVLAALRWVRDNIAAFGGDPKRVTLFGESAGAGSSRPCSPPRPPRACSPARSPRARRPLRYTTRPGAACRGAASGHAGHRPVRRGRLSDVPTAAILAASRSVRRSAVRNPGTLAFVPIVDGDLLPDYPVKLAREGRHTRSR